MNRTLIARILESALALAASMASAADFYVAPGGDDANRGVPVAGDSDECHPYHFIFSPNQPFRLRDLAGDPGTKPGLLIAQPYAAEKALRKNPLIIKEYGGLWLNRDGTPTTLSQRVYDYLLEPSATTAQRRQLYARTMAAITEFFRAHRQAAGVLHFCALGYSRPVGQTSDDWADVEELTWYPDLGAVQTVSRLEMPGTFERGRTPTSYVIQVSPDGEFWQEAFSTNAGTKTVVTARFKPVSARWVRIMFRQVEDAKSYSLNEVSIFHDNETDDR